MNKKKGDVFKVKSKKLLIIGMIALLGLFACNQKEKPRYDQNGCPFCSLDPGKCSYCEGSGKCSYCNGTGIRKTHTIAPKGSKIKKIVIPEKCPFCNGTGKCSYCKGSGKCRVCKGNGKLDKWKW